jgi:HAD superfamily hydrolase (TIGR01459 family)
MQHLTGFADLAARYDAFIIDLWGVIHDGVTPYEGAVDCLLRLRAAGKPTVLLSNAPRRAHVAQQAMRTMGIEDELYTGILTSGEVTHRLLRDREDPWFAALGKRVFHLGQDRDLNVVETLPVELVDEPAEADFVLNTGAHEGLSLTDVTAYEGVLGACRGAGLPMVCANPDLEVIREGARWICAGAMAQRYEAMGGEARWVGKPDPAVYAPVLEILSAPKPRVLAVGDALRTDMAGAAAVGVDGCWVLGGIHAEELGADPALVDRTAKAAGLSPVAAIPAFMW